MIIIVRHRITKNEYVLLNFSSLSKQNSLPTRLMNDFFDSKDSDNSDVAIVCDAMGNIVQIYIEDLIVTQIDGQHLTEILPKTPSSSKEDKLETASKFKSEIKPQVQDNSEKPVEDNFDEDDEEWI